MVIELTDDFREFLKLLNARHVDYLLVGGFAVSFHGYPRATQDIDLWVRNSPDNADRIVLAIRDFGFSTPNLSADLFQQEGKIVRMGHPPIRIEIMTRIDGVTFDQCRPNRIVADVDGIAVPVIGLADLIANKRASGRHKDLDDIENLPH